jgi:hypothetical protein
MEERFVSESIQPAAGTANAGAMSRGEPGLPHAFTWRGRRYDVGQIEQTWKTSTVDRGNPYLRRHWFRFSTTSGERMTIYCLRQVKDRQHGDRRWWLYSFTPAGPGEAPAEDAGNRG